MPPIVWDNRKNPPFIFYYLPHYVTSSARPHNQFISPRVNISLKLSTDPDEFKGKSAPSAHMGLNESTHSVFAGVGIPFRSLPLPLCLLIKNSAATSCNKPQDGLDNYVKTGRCKYSSSAPWTVIFEPPQNAGPRLTARVHSPRVKEIKGKVELLWRKKQRPFANNWWCEATEVET